MKKIAKVISLVLSLALLAGAFGIVARAEGKPTITVGTAQASAGDTVKVDVVLSDCEQFSSYTIRISYDSEYVTVVEAKKRVSKGIYQFNPSVDGKKELIIVGGDVDNITENGPIATIEFKIAEDFPGGVTEVPLKIVRCKLTEYKNQKDIEFETEGVDGKLIVSGVGSSVIWNGGDGENEITPAELTDEQAAEYTNPLTNAPVTGGGDYYVNEEKKIAIPAADVESGVTADPDTWKVVEIEKPDEPEDTDPADGSAQGSEPAGKDEGKLNWLLIGCIAGGAAVVIAGVIAVIAIMKKKNKTEQE